MAVEPVNPQILQASSPKDERNAWIEARMAEFAEHPEMRDRAIATILHDIMAAAEAMQQINEGVRKEGLGGVLKALGGAVFNGK